MLKHTRILKYVLNSNCIYVKPENIVVMVSYLIKIYTKTDHIIILNNSLLSLR